jgi:hypothetical protein
MPGKLLYSVVEHALPSCFGLWSMPDHTHSVHKNASDIVYHSGTSRNWLYPDVGPTMSIFGERGAIRDWPGDNGGSAVPREIMINFGVRM